MKLLLIDGNGVFYRAYHAFPKDMTSPDGQPSGAVYGFARILLSTLKTIKPDCAAVCFDMKGSTLRQALFPDYKATRSKMPEDLAAQTTRMREVVEHLELPVYRSQGYEADDLIGTLSLQAMENPETEVIILTGDQDLIQLVDTRVSVYMPATPPKAPTIFTPKTVQDKYGFSPIQMIEYKALRGDPSDNIPGIPGIGEVTAKKLLQEFASIDILYSSLLHETPSIKPAVRQKLIEHEASARMSHTLATILRNAPVKLELGDCMVGLNRPEALVAFFSKLGFKSLLRELPVSQNLLANAADVFETTPDNRSAEIDAKLAPVLRAMEAVGVKVDRPYLLDLEGEFSADLTAKRDRVHVLAGQEFLLNSPSQVAHILYEVLQIPTNGIRKGKTGYTTDAATLQELATDYPIAALLLQYREIDKLQGTYVLPLQALADSADRIHTSYAPDTSTGRISSRNPNLQNIPVKTEQGRRLRRAFITEPGWTLVAADYSQMELRVAAHLSGDTVMQDVFRAGGDFHEQTAKRMGVDRRTAKMLNFSILYGKGPFGFAQDLDISVAEAKGFIDQYFKTYAKLREYLDNLLEGARNKGYTETLYGRRRAFPNLTSSNFQLRSAAEREALNMPIQGTQADILKDAMCTLAEKLQGQTARLILTVHDELVVETPQAEQEQTARLLEEVMVEAAELDVPVSVSVKCGTNWDALEAI